MKLYLAVPAVIALALTVWVMFLWRVQTNTLNANRLCKSLSALVARNAHNLGKPGTASYIYFREHPGELKAAKRQARDTLSQLPC